MNAHQEIRRVPYIMKTGAFNKYLTDGLYRRRAPVSTVNGSFISQTLLSKILGEN
jgi:hypothetical protein